MLGLWFVVYGLWFVVFGICLKGLSFLFTG
jgi:hypothetical protein